MVASPGHNVVRLLVMAIAGLAVLACRGSGDGRLLFAAQRSIVSRDVASGKETLLLAPVGGNGVMLRDPALSPDGKRIAYVRSAPAAATNAAPSGDLWIANVDGSDTHPSIQQPAVFIRHPAWTDDQHLIATVSSPGGADLEVISAGTGEHIPLVPGGLEYALSRDGRLIAYTKALPGGATGLFVANLDGSSERALPGTLDPFAAIAALSFAPDGRAVAFAAPSDDGRAAIWQAATDGSPPSQVAEVAEPVIALTYGRGDDRLFVLTSGSLWEATVADGAVRQLLASTDMSALAWVP